MSSPAATPATPLPPEQHEFDLLEFWIRHQSRILLYGGLLIAALLIYGIYEIARQRTLDAAEHAYAAATTADDFRKVIDQYSGTIVAGNARLMLADKLRADAKLDESNTVLRQFVEKHAEHPLLSGAHTSLATNLEAQGKLNEALQTYQKVTASFPKSFSAPAAWMAQARIYKTQGKTEDARRIYDTVIAQYPQSVFEAEASRESQALKK